MPDELCSSRAVPGSRNVTKSLLAPSISSINYSVLRSFIVTINTMKRVTLFSKLTEENKGYIGDSIFPKEINNRVLAYMPSAGIKATPQKYIDEWKMMARDFNAKFNLIDNTSSNDKEKILQSNILVISGGNTFTLLDNLRKSGLDKTIKEFVDKSEFSIAGFSAGAIILTPTIAICNLPGFDVNNVGLEDLTGLGVVNFEVFPHYDITSYQSLFDERQRRTNYEIRKISDDSLISLDL